MGRWNPADTVPWKIGRGVRRNRRRWEWQGIEMEKRDQLTKIGYYNSTEEDVTVSLLHSDWEEKRNKGKEEGSRASWTAGKGRKRRKWKVKGWGRTTLIMPMLREASSHSKR